MTQWHSTNTPSIRAHARVALAVCLLGKSKVQAQWPFLFAPLLISEVKMCEITQIVTRANVRVGVNRCHIGPFGSCPVYPNSDRIADIPGTAVSCDIRTLAPLQTELSFDHLVGDGEQRRWDGQAERLGRLEIDYQIKSRGLLDQQIAGLRTLQNFVNICRGTAKQIGGVCSITHKRAGQGILPGSCDDQRQPIIKREFGRAPRQAAGTGSLL